jgi:hypothetical protein
MDDLVPIHISSSNFPSELPGSKSRQDFAGILQRAAYMALREALGRDMWEELPGKEVGGFEVGRHKGRCYEEGRKVMVEHKKLQSGFGRALEVGSQRVMDSQRNRFVDLGHASWRRIGLLR